MTVHLNNPAGRLHELFSRGQKENGKARADEVWAKLLNVPLGDMPLLLRRLARVMEMPAHLVLALDREKGINKDLYCRWQTGVQNALSMIDLRQPWSSVVGHISELTLMSLEHCDELLYRSTDEPRYDEAQLQALSAEVTELFEAVVASDMDADLKAFILRHLQAVLQAIQEVRISGFGPVMSAVEQTLGAGLTHPSLLSKAGKAKPLVQRMFLMLSRIATLAQLLDSSFALEERVALMLPEADMSSHVKAVGDFPPTGEGDPT